jgi:short-subunit dehydrogenase
VNSGVSAPGSAADAESIGIKTTPADKAAEIIIEGIEKNSYRVLVGPDAKFMDFISRLAPERAAKIIYQQMKSLLPA